MNPEILLERMFDYLHTKSRIQFPEFIEVKKNLEEINITKEKFVNRNTF